MGFGSLDEDCPPDALPDREEKEKERPAHASTSERARQREIASYLSAASVPLAHLGSQDTSSSSSSSPSSSSPPSTSPSPPSSPPPEPYPILCADSNLTALVQLGALRLDTDRAFLSLIDGSHQYIVAEATRSHSLTIPNKYDRISRPNDAIYLGVCSLHISFGVCPNTINVFTGTAKNLKELEDDPNIEADRSRYIIRDFVSDPRFSERPYVKGFPYMRSYAEVPLTSPLGYVIGSYCVVDTQLREYGDAEIGVLSEIADMIMSHLELVRTKLSYTRSQKLLDGLKVYMCGDSSVRDGWAEGSGRKEDAQHETEHLTIEEPAVVSEVQLPPPNVIAEGIVSDTTSTTPEEASVATALDSSGAESLSTATTDPFSLPSAGVTADVEFDIPPDVVVIAEPPTSTSPTVAPEIDADIEQASPSPEDADLGALLQESIVSTEVRKTFSRAASLLCESMQMSGLLFLDACPSQFGTRSNYPAPHNHDEAANSDTEDEYASQTVAPLCARFATASHPRHPVSDINNLPLTEALLRRIIRRYPKGHIFSADEFGPIDERYSSANLPSELAAREPFERRSREKENIEELFRLLPGARSIIFVPLWHFQKERWFAGTLGWTTDFTQQFTKSDITFLSAFGNSIMAEISRFESLAVSKAKSDFISAVSHELRSPLHGILASAELLREPLQASPELAILDMIESCGTTLLDTMNHILDFAKINGLTKPSTSGKDRKTSLAMPLTQPIITDLGAMVQDVVEGVYIGHSLKSRLSSDLTADLFAPAAPILAPANLQDPSAHDPPVLVSVDIDPTQSWRMHIDVGAWKRIVINIVGNALKYTPAGHISVALRIVDVARPKHLAVLEQESYAEEDERDGYSSLSGTSTPLGPEGGQAGKGANGRNGAANAPHPPPLSARRRPHICLSVRDSGIGIAKDYLRYQLFTPFAQENPLAAGAGLGLSIVRQIIEGLGGWLEIESEVRVGTRVRVFVPCEEDEKEKEESSQSGMLESVLDDGDGEEEDGGVVLPPMEDVPTPLVESTAKPLEGKTLCLLAPASSPSYARLLGAKKTPVATTLAHGVRRLLALRSAIAGVAGPWLGLKVVTAKTPEEFPYADVFVAEWEYLEKISVIGGAGEDSTVRKELSAPVVAVCYDGREGAGAKVGGVVGVSQPLGPKKLIAAIVEAINMPRPSSRTAPIPRRDTMLLLPKELPLEHHLPGTPTYAAVEQPNMLVLPLPAQDISIVGAPLVATITPPADIPVSQDELMPTTFPVLVQPSVDPLTLPTPPADTVSLQEKTEHAIPPSTISTTPPKPHILLVDDNAINLKILSMHVKRLGCTYVAATNGLEAVEAVKAAGSQPFDCVFMDLSMPVMNGFVASREIRAWERSERRANPTLIVALTGLGSHLSQQEAFSSGINQYWTKPVKLGALTELLKNGMTT